MAGTVRAGEILFSGSIPGITAEEAQRENTFSMVTRHFHESLELYILLEGERFYFIDQDTCHVKEGMAVLINRSQIHKTSMAGSRQLHRRFLLQIDGAHFAGQLQLLGFSPWTSLGDRYWGLCEFPAADWEQVLSCLASIRRELTARSSQSVNLVTLQTMTLLSLFCKNRLERESAPWPSRHVVHSAMYQRVHEIALCLQNESASPLSLEELASRFYISKSYLTRIFKSVTGFTVTEYQTFCRIRKAKLLLTETSLPVTEIAQQTGFGNITYFERVFKQSTGLSPLIYRKGKVLIPPKKAR